MVPFFPCSLFNCRLKKQQGVMHRSILALFSHLQSPPLPCPPSPHTGPFQPSLVHLPDALNM